MADVLVMFKKSDLVPMVVTQKHIDKIAECISGQVYWCADEEEALEKGYDAEVLFLWGGSGVMPERYCRLSEKLKWINSFSAGVNPIMDSSIRDLPVRLTNAKGIHGKTMALTTIGYMISFMRYFPELQRRQNKHIWSKKFDVQPKEAENSTVAIVGAGSIGSEIGRLSKALGMKVLGIKRTVTPLEYFDEVYSNDEIDTVIAQADFVVIVTPLTDATRHMFHKDRFKVMKPDAVLINIARGQIVKEDDLIEALQNGEIGGAALDATYNEPLEADSPLWDMDNVIVTPHYSADSGLYMERAMELFCENLKRFESEETLINEINLKNRY
jgi:Phosphoglycerate dehydrogenase and related dehydrogenases